MDHNEKREYLKEQLIDYLEIKRNEIEKIVKMVYN